MRNKSLVIFVSIISFFNFKIEAAQTNSSVNSGIQSDHADSAYSIKEPRIMQLLKAYGTIYSQQKGLEIIREKFPQLNKEITEAQFAFNTSALGESMKGIKEELQEILGKKYSVMLKSIESDPKMTSIFHKFNETLTMESATEYLKLVHRRSKGELPGNLVSYILSAHPIFSKNPGKEIVCGWQQTFRTKDHEKANGVDISISLPVSWHMSEAYRPHIVKKFQSHAGYGPASCMLVVKELSKINNRKATEKEKQTFILPDMLKEMLPEKGVFIRTAKTTLDGRVFGVLVYDITLTRMDIEGSMRITQLVTTIKDSLVIIGFSVTEMPNSKKTLGDLEKQFKPTFKMIANTIVFNDQYK